MLTPFNNWESSSTYRPSQKPRTLIVSTLNAYKAPWMRCVMLRVKPNKKNLKLLVDWQTYYSSSSNHYNLPYKNPSKPSMNWNMLINASQICGIASSWRQRQSQMRRQLPFPGAARELNIYRNCNFCKKIEISKDFVIANVVSPLVKTELVFFLHVDNVDGYFWLMRCNIYSIIDVKT